jgi:hypothetical protein
MSIVPSGAGGDGAVSELPALLKRWLAIQEEIASLNNELKQRRTVSRTMKDMIMRIMETSNVVQLNTSKGAVVHRTRTVTERLSSESMLKHFKEFFGGDEAKALALIAYLDEHRGTVIKHDLKLQMAKGEDDKMSRRS